MHHRYFQWDNFIVTEIERHSCIFSPIHRKVISKSLKLTTTDRALYLENAIRIRMPATSKQSRKRLIGAAVNQEDTPAIYSAFQ